MEVIKGRMYDYNNGRFLSVDPFIQAPTSTQSMNPYTYIFNNPLSGVDPTGYIVECESTKSCDNIDVSNIDTISIDKDGNLTATFADGSTDTISAQAAGAVAADILVSNGIGSIQDTSTIAAAFTGAISAIGKNPGITAQGVYNAAIAGARKFGTREAAKAVAGILGRVTGILAGIFIPTGTASDEEMKNLDATRLVMAAINESLGKGEGGLTTARIDTSGGSAQMPPDPDDEDYENPGHHDPSGGPNQYNSNKSVLPNNHRQLWSRSKPDPKNPNKTRWTKEGTGKNTVYHRFKNNGNGKWHWTGATRGATRGGSARNLDINKVPKEIKKL